MASSITDYPSALLASLKEAKLVPGPAEVVISPAFTPTFDLKVSFDSKPVSLGKFFKAGECKPVPAVSFSPVSATSSTTSSTDEQKNDRTYLFMMIDPDAPTPADPKFAFWRHYVVTDLTVGGGGEDGKVVTEYLAPGPKEEYVYLLLSSFSDCRRLAILSRATNSTDFTNDLPRLCFC